MATPWQVGLKSFKAGDPATVGIQKIWDSMMPPANLNLLAQVVGALWANTYWDTTKMSVNKLAADINSAIGINMADATRAAQYAFGMWCGLQVRANFSDNGSIPRGGTLTASPDVVLNGQNQLTTKQLIEMWNQTVWSPTAGLKNYVYGRAQSLNIGVDITQPYLRGFYSDAGFNPPPSSWIQMFTWDKTGDTSPLTTIDGGTTISPGVRAADGDANAFKFTPPGSGHYCLIVLACTEFFANDPTHSGSNWSSQEWITYNGAAGWHNVDVASTGVHALKFYNEDATPETFAFEAHCYKLPPGTRVGLSVQEGNDRALGLHVRGNELKSTARYQALRVSGTVPPNYAGVLKVLIETPDRGPLPAEASIEVRQLWQLGPGHANYLDAVRQGNNLRAHALGERVEVKLGEYTFVGEGYGKL